MANSYGFNNPNLTIPLPVTASAYPLLTDPAQIALSAIGQFNDTETPLQEAMVAATIANHGTTDAALPGPARSRRPTSRRCRAPSRQRLRQSDHRQLRPAT